MDQDFIYELAKKFAPTYWASEGERCYLAELEQNRVPRIHRGFPAWDPIVYFSAIQLNPRDAAVAYEIDYFTIWDQDTGGKLGSWNGHLWDTERTAILITGTEDKEDINLFSAKEAYYAAHEGVPFVDKSRFCQCVSTNCGVTVYWSEGKHASYPDNPCLFSIFESFESPGYECKPEDYTLINIGTIKDPKTPWVLYKEGWGPENVGSIYKKLKTRLWMRKILQAIEKIRYTKEQLKNFQRIENLPVTGELDRDTMIFSTLLWNLVKKYMHME
ncbi:MAG: peptidoglycan-binding protein [Theionarchaea archaeon]|nr:peptidoglycan-binding protein [Theionarchaea archaeon]